MFVQACSGIHEELADGFGLNFRSTLRKEEQSDLRGHQTVTFVLWTLQIDRVHHNELRVEATPSLIFSWEVSLEKLAGGEDGAELSLLNVLILALMVPDYLKALLDLATRDEVHIKRLLLLDHVGFLCGDGHTFHARTRGQLKRVYHAAIHATIFRLGVT